MQLPNGVFAATLTPMHSDLSVDHDLLYRHCRGLLDQGGDGIALLGTTGEANSFALFERKEVLEELLKRGFPAERLLVGTGCCSVPETADLSRHATDLGVGGVLVLPPFFYKRVDDEGVYRFFSSLIDQVRNPDLHVYLYHFPKMSGIFMSTAVIARMAHDFPGIIVGMKDSSGNVANMREVMTAIPRFRLYAGNEKYLLDVLELGGVGCISATTNYSMSVASKVYKAWQAGGVPIILSKEMNDIRDAFEGHVFPTALKGVFAQETGLLQWNHIRPPMMPLGKETIAAIRKNLLAID